MVCEGQSARACPVLCWQQWGYVQRREWSTSFHVRWFYFITLGSRSKKNFQIEPCLWSYKNPPSLPVNSICWSPDLPRANSSTVKAMHMKKYSQYDFRVTYFPGTGQAYVFCCFLFGIWPNQFSTETFPEPHVIPCNRYGSSKVKRQVLGGLSNI